MRIGIDGACWNNRRGYGRFLRELLPALLRSKADHSYTLFLDSANALGLPECPHLEAVYVPTSRAVGEAATASGRRSLADLARMGLAVRRCRMDLFFFPSVYSWFPLLHPVPTVAGIHDTIADRNPHLAFDSRLQELFWRVKVFAAAAQATTILTVSNYSRRSIVEFFRVPGSRVRVLSEAASAIFRPPPPALSRQASVLYAGGISPNKNLATLVRAFAQMRQQETRLILAGDYEGDRFKGCYGELRDLVRALNLDDRVTFTGYVPDEELCRLYQECGVFAMPSLDEGFGLPAVEAMACGAPVVVSRGHALEEMVGDAGILVDAGDVASLSAALESVLSRPALARELSERSLRRAARFSWDQAASTLLAVFEETLQSALV